jgi:erythromycin esterase
VRFRNRSEAGQRLSKRVLRSEWQDAVVLALPRGGVPVAVALAQKLGVPLQVLIVRKLGAPLQPEFALGALVEDGTVWLNEGAIRFEAVKSEELAAIREREWRRIQDQKSSFRHGEELPSLAGKKVILVDDGIATGATMFAAIEAVKKQGAIKILVAVPVCAASTSHQIAAAGAELLALAEPERLISVGMWFDDFSQVEDKEVIGELGGSSRRRRSSERLSHLIADRLQPLEEDADLAPLIAHVRHCKVVMLGEATHGTSEFYRFRARLSNWLLKNENYSFVAVEGDWPDAERLQRHIRNGRYRSAKEVMKSFRRWPTWLWANAETADFIEERKKSERAGFYGLDVYSLFESMNCVLDYASRENPFLARLLRERYACFEPFERDEYAYARSLQRFPEGCAHAVLQSLETLLRERLSPGQSHEARFSAEQNARIVVNAEAYYRALLGSDEQSWNVRDSHMLDTLDQIFGWCSRSSKPERGIVWAHNTHVGDYRATDMAAAGYVNLGGLARQTYGADQVALVGLGTYAGKVVASRAWGGREQVLSIPPAKPGSWEAYFHEALRARNLRQGYVLFDSTDHEGAFAEVLGHRAIGVVYHPGHEGRGNFVPTALSRRYDAFVMFDETHPLHSLHSPHLAGRFPETWPKGV